MDMLWSSTLLLVGGALLLTLAAAGGALWRRGGTGGARRFIPEVLRLLTRIEVRGVRHAKVETLLRAVVDAQGPEESDRAIASLLVYFAKVRDPVELDVRPAARREEGARGDR